MIRVAIRSDTICCAWMQYDHDLVQALISVRALVFDLAQLTCQKRFNCRNTILGYSATLLGMSYSLIVVALLL